MLVNVGGVCSESRNILSEVPQESVLSHFYF